MGITPAVEACLLLVIGILLCRSRAPLDWPALGGLVVVLVGCERAFTAIQLLFPTEGWAYYVGILLQTAVMLVPFVPLGWLWRSWAPPMAFRLSVGCLVFCLSPAAIIIRAVTIVHQWHPAVSYAVAIIATLVGLYRLGMAVHRWRTKKR